MALDSTQVIRIYTTRLVNSLVPQEFGEEYIQSVTRELLNLFLARSQNRDATRFRYDIETIMNQFKRMFISTGRISEWSQFQSTIDALMSVKNIDQVKNYLVFLSTLKEDSSTSRPQSTNSPLNPTSRPSDQFQNQFPFQGQKSGNIPDISENFQPPERSLFLDIHSSPYGKYSSGIGNIHGIVMEELIKPYYETLDEQVILTYLPYTLIGVDSKIFTFRQQDDQITIQIPLNINNSYSSLLAQILEPPLIFLKLKSFLASNVANGNHAQGLSPIKVSYLALLDNSMNEYGNFVDQMFNNQRQKLDTLIKVYRELSPHVLKLRLLYSLTSQLNLLGYDFLMRVYELTKFGDIIIRQTASDLFDGISTSYYEILEHWILRGDLIDSTNDFFIEFDKDQRHINDIIKYIPQKVPKFFITINKDIGFKIFQIGKLLIFLGQYCRELNWINGYINKFSRLIFGNSGTSSGSSGLKYTSANTINDIINSQYDDLVNHFTYLVHGKYELIAHLNNYRKFLLMGCNDFIDSLIIKGNDLFNEPSNQLTSNQLGKILVDAINFSSVNNYDMNFKNRLDARILDLSHGNIGWQVFTLEYNINDLPITHIINYNNMGLEYLKMFNFLWKLKQFNYLLVDNYMESNHIKKNDLKQFNQRYKKLIIRNRASAGGDRKNLKDYKIEFIIKSFRIVNMIRYKLIKFLNLIIEYIAHQIDVNFTQLIDRFYKKNHQSKSIRVNLKFMNTIKDNFKTISHGVADGSNNAITNLNALNFDEIIQVNADYVGMLNSKLLNASVIGKSGESYINRIYQLLETIFQFIKSHEEYLNLLTNYISMLNIDKNLMTNDLDNDLDDIEMNLKQIFQKIHKQIFNSFNTDYQVLVKDLKSDLDLKEFAKFF